jgi:hypothetical protein
VLNPNSPAILHFERVLGVRQADPLDDPVQGYICRGAIVTVQRVEHHQYADVCTVEHDGVVAEVLSIYLEAI